MARCNENSKDHAEEESMEEQTLISQETIGPSKRNVRGVTRGLSLQKKSSAQKLDIVIHPKRNRILGPNAMYFKTEACVIVKQHAYLQYGRWKDIPMDTKRKMWLEMKKVSDRNKGNRQKLKMKHACGTKSIAQYCYEERDTGTGDEPSRTAAWRMSRYNHEKKEWSDQASKEVYEELIRLQTEPLENGKDPMDGDEAFVQVLGEEKASRLRGCGDGLKPPSTRGARLNLELQKENEELRKENKDMSSRLESLEAQFTNQEGNIHAQVEALLRVQLPAMLQGLSQNSQIPNFD
ncbi:hypothetical protein C2S53_011957 [Perilla frutescens var. hirtella]|uniref:Uncharacterized protein n=1 Tax=Perilla frutescens var. hirtella TaxID=608512 RepID=A0AAD4IRY0_PERFH|nr:hypothetical protein C2S53_011957 [Perilla frutescens var. hirtella]